MTNEQSTRTSVFDVWLTDGRFDAKRFAHDNIKVAMNDFVELAQTPIDLTPEAPIVTYADFLAWVATSANTLYDIGKRFQNGKRQVVYWCVMWAKSLPKRERARLLAEMPRAFRYQLGKTASKAWVDILANCNTFPGIARKVGRGKLPQKTFADVSASVTLVCSAFESPNARRREVVMWFDDFFAANDIDAKKRSPTALATLYWEQHADSVTILGQKRAAEARAQVVVANKVSAVLAGKLAYLDSTERVQTATRQRLAEMGIPGHRAADLDQIASARKIDPKRQDAIGSIQQALDGLARIKAELSVLLNQARDAVANAPKPDLPSASLPLADMLALTDATDGQDYSVFTHATLEKAGKRYADVRFANGKSQHGLRVSVQRFYRIRKACGLQASKPDAFTVALTMENDKVAAQA